jgi:hypothetical protein
MLPVPGRPYALHPGDEIQIRRTIRHPEHGQLRNGTIAHIAAIDRDAGSVDLRLAEGEAVTLDPEQAALTDLRLAYVQHPFPAQGQTTDTAHVIVGEHATREGSYVALTRARQQTQIYGASGGEELSGGDRLQQLAERMSRTESDLPSIDTPLANEAGIRVEFARTDVDGQHNIAAAPLMAEPSATLATTPREPAAAVRAANEADARDSAGPPNRDPTQRDPWPENSPGSEPAATRHAGEALEEQSGRAWRRSRRRELVTPDLTNDQIEAIHHHGWEP